MWDNAAVRERFARCVVEQRRLDALCAQYTARERAGDRTAMVLKVAGAECVQELLDALHIGRIVIHKGLRFRLVLRTSCRFLVPFVPCFSRPGMPNFFECASIRTRDIAEDRGGSG